MVAGAAFWRLPRGCPALRGQYPTATARFRRFLQNCHVLVGIGAFLLLLCGISLSVAGRSQRPMVEICSSGSCTHHHRSHRTPMPVCGRNLAVVPRCSLAGCGTFQMGSRAAERIAYSCSSRLAKSGGCVLLVVYRGSRAGIGVTHFEQFSIDGCAGWAKGAGHGLGYCCWHCTHMLGFGDRVFCRICTDSDDVVADIRHASFDSVAAVVRLRSCEAQGPGNSAAIEAQRAVRAGAAGIHRFPVGGGCDRNHIVHTYDFTIPSGRIEPRHDRECYVWDRAGLGLGASGEARKPAH